MQRAFIGLAVCQCGQCVEDHKIVACAKCGDASCEDCWLECEYCDELVCLNCGGYGTDRLCYQCEHIVKKAENKQLEAGYKSKGFLIVAGDYGKKYEIKDPKLMIEATGYSHSQPALKALHIKGLGKLKYSYRSMQMVYDTEPNGIQKEIGMDYFFYCYRIDEDENFNPPF